MRACAASCVFGTPPASSGTGPLRSCPTCQRQGQQHRCRRSWAGILRLGRAPASSRQQARLAPALTPRAACDGLLLECRQAEADAVVLSRLLEAAGRHVAAQLAAARADAEAGRAEAAAARRQLAEQVTGRRGLRGRPLPRSCALARCMDMQALAGSLHAASACHVHRRGSSSGPGWPASALCNPCIAPVHAGRELQEPAEGGAGARGGAAAAAAAPAGGAADGGACWWAHARATGTAYPELLALRGRRSLWSRSSEPWAFGRQYPSI